MKWKAHILIVDDITDNVRLAMNVLKELDLDFSYALDGEKAIELADRTSFDLILLDIMMPGTNGYEVCKRLKSMDHTQDVPIIFLTARSDVDSISKGFEYGGADYITKPFHAEELLSRVSNQLELNFSRQELKRQNIQLQQSSRVKEYRYTSELEDNQKEIIAILMGLTEKTSSKCDYRSKRIAEASCSCCKLYPGLTTEDSEVIFHAALVLDIGNIGLPLAPFEKQESLNQEEINIIRSHTANAGQILMDSSRKFIHAARIIATQHHERWDGSGYPKQLVQENIHVYARIVAVFDVFEAMTHDRPHRKAHTAEQAIEYISSNRDILFDPKVVDIFLSNIDEFKQIILN